MMSTHLKQRLYGCLGESKSLWLPMRLKRIHFLLVFCCCLLWAVNPLVAEAKSFSVTTKVFTREPQLPEDTRQMAALDAEYKAWLQAASYAAALVPPSAYVPQYYFLALMLPFSQSENVATEEIQEPLPGVALTLSFAVDDNQIKALHQRLPRDQDALPRYQQLIAYRFRLMDEFRHYREQFLTLSQPLPTELLQQGEHLREAIQAWSVLRKGNQALDQKRYQDAITLFEQRLMLQPTDSFAQVYAAVAYIHLGQIPQALTYLDKAIKNDARNRLAYLKRAMIYMALQKYTLAMADYDQAILLNKNDPDAYSGRGIAAFTQQKYMQARNDFDRAIELRPGDAELYNNHGFTSSTMGQHQNALVYFNQALRLKPDYAQAYNNRGSAYLNLKAYPQAMADYQKAIALLPNFALAYNNLAFAYKLTGKCAESQKLYLKACQLGYSAACKVKCP